jgi:hypothetical protein
VVLGDFGDLVEELFFVEADLSGEQGAHGNSVVKNVEQGDCSGRGVCGEGVDA